jgi:DNA helicase-2/ATP-dependent DNA helicase PcrA
MEFIADFHIHSKFSRATSKSLDLENLYIAAQLKGITLVGTGDFTYPAWFSEIREKLIPVEPGLFRLKDEIATICDQEVPQSCRSAVRFVLTTEISNIYKKNGKTRKNHNLVWVPDLEIAAQFIAKLDKIGNIKSDGRPILGLDARDLLEILLETSDQAMLIPAHIWTPWFSVLGSKSGFDSIAECFEDLTPYIVAVETGLSSDPPMNWRVSGLDGLTLISNSDAHSASNLGREANLFNTQLAYPAIKSAIETGEPQKFLGTFEFYPEEGKYHWDGHRNCKVSFQPQKTIAQQGRCPVCEKPLTLGVLYRVEELADRPEGQKPEHCHPYHNLIPLTDILSEILRVGSKSQKVIQSYRTVIHKLGPEFDILHKLDSALIEKAGIPLLSEAIQRMRQKKIRVIPGYDGEYGRVKIFDNQERQQLMGQKLMFSFPLKDTCIQTETGLGLLTPEASQLDFTQSKKIRQISPALSKSESSGILMGLNSEQRRAVEHPGGPLLMIAGPGTGKTRTLTHRIAHMITERGVAPQNILAVTFTNKAAQEMRERLVFLLGGANRQPLVATFHSLCFKLLRDLKPGQSESIIDNEDRKHLVSEAINYLKNEGLEVCLTPPAILKRIIEAKQKILGPDDTEELVADNESERKLFTAVYRTYQNLLSIQGLYDYEDLIFNVVRLLETDPDARRTYHSKFKHIFVDEYQDLNQGQYRIIQALAPPQQSGNDICVIGDPDQSIYGFRGSDLNYFKRFINDYPDTAVIRLMHNYRSTQTILDVSYQIIRAHGAQSPEARIYSQINGVKTISVLELADEKAEAEAVAGIIEKLVGGTGFHSIDTGRIDDANLSRACSYSDFAVLYRTNEQNRIIADVFDRYGIPFQIASRQHVLNQPGLREVISLLKVVEGCGGFLDYEKAMALSKAGIGRKSRDLFKTWCYQNRFSLSEGLIKAKRFPVAGLDTSSQQMLNDFSNQMEEFGNKTAGMTVAGKLFYLIENSKLSSLLQDGAKGRDALDRLLKLSDSYDNRATDFLATVALQTDTDSYSSRVEKVCLMTMHAAKGLEFTVVFITGCEQDFIPFKRSNHEPADVAEERRLFYVAITRAMERLYLTYAKSRRIFGKLQSRSLSPFVADIETRLKKDESPRSKKQKRGQKQRQLKLF